MSNPTTGLLVSMAIRFDHALAIDGYYDRMPSFPGETHASRLASTMRTMRQLWEEVTGNGFYRPEREAEYSARAAVLPQAQELPRPNFEMVNFYGVDPMAPTKGAALPMIPESWRFGFYRVNGALCFGLLDDGPFVAHAAVQPAARPIEAELIAALKAIEPWIPTTSASDGGAARHSENVRAADKVRAAIARWDAAA